MNTRSLPAARLPSALLALSLLAAPAAPAAAGETPTDARIAAWVAESIVSDAVAPPSAEDLLARDGVISDAAIALEASHRVARRLGTDLAGSAVSCHDGVVLLRGRVSSAALREAAGEAARHTRGALAVHNLIAVGSDPAPPAPAPPPARDTGPGFAGPLAFLTPDLLAGRDLTVEVRGGAVRLRGVVSSREAHQHLTAAVRRIPGVRIVRNEAVVRDGSREDDRRVALIVFRRLQHEPDVQSVTPAIDVAVRDGVVRLQGTVRTDEQRLVALALAAGVRSVVGVDDRLQVDPRLQLTDEDYDVTRNPAATIPGP